MRYRKAGTLELEFVAINFERQKCDLYRCLNGIGEQGNDATHDSKFLSFSSRWWSIFWVWKKLVAVFLGRNLVRLGISIWQSHFSCEKNCYDVLESKENQDQDEMEWKKIYLIIYFTDKPFDGVKIHFNFLNFHFMKEVI